MHFVCPDGEPQYEGTVARLSEQLLTSAGHTFEYFNDVPTTSDELQRRITGADGLLVLYTVPAEMLSASTSVKVLSWCGTGVGTFIDLGAAAGGGVTVCNVPSYGADAIAEHALALLFAVARRITEGNSLVHAGKWGQEEGLELTGNCLGVVGAGAIGARMMQLGKSLGMEVLAWTRTPSQERAEALGVTFVSLEELFDRADAVSIHVAHTPETERLIGRSLLERMHPRSILINTARAEVVDTEVLAELVANRRIWGAGVDVFDAEPPAASDPLLGAERIVLSPHTAFYTARAVEEQYRVAIANLRAFADGQPVNVVTGP